jgi:hypothetical protein
VNKRFTRIFASVVVAGSLIGAGASHTADLKLPSQMSRSTHRDRVLRSLRTWFSKRVAANL